MKNKHTLYWRCQITGWLCIVLANLLLRINNPDLNLQQELFGAVLLFVTGVSGTHLLRVGYHKVRLLDKKLRHVVLAVPVLSLITAVIITAVSLCSLGIYQHLLGDEGPFFTREMFLINTFNLYLMTIGWSALYVAINYFLRFKQAELEKLKLENELKSAQLNTLMGQINPHFMFNSLNNIRALMLEDVDKARDMLTILSKVLRYSLTADKHQFISLQQELDIVEDFIQLAKIQLEERLNYQKDVQVCAEQVKIPPMVIQMLIENAIKHGISEISGGGLLQLNITKQQNELTICVTNPGTLNKRKSEETSTGLGLANINKRLLLLYPEGASLTLTEQQNTVRASVVIPFRESTHHV